MKNKIKVKVLTQGCLPEINAKGDWVDLRAAEDVSISSPYAVSRTKTGGEASRKVKFPTSYIPLGIAVKLPTGFEAIVALRSSSNKNFNISEPVAIGIIDNTYCGNNDQWKLPIIATGDVDIKKGDRVCQFRIQLSQKATIWQKIKWMLSSGIEIVEVSDLGDENRGGIGSTGIK